MNPKDRKHIGFNDPGERRVECECGDEVAMSDLEYHKEECDE